MSKTILIVEDELLIARDLKNILTEEGYAVINDIDSIEDALIAIDTHKPDLIILDINLKKDKDGVDLGKLLLAKDSIPFIYITSFTDSATIEKVSLTRPYGFIVKPYNPLDVKITVAIALTNFVHRKIDVIRNCEDLDDEVPFIMKQVVNYINEHVYEKIEISDLIKLTRWDSQHFTRMFHKYLGVTPHKYILNRKFEKAKILLSESNIPITQISYELGFKSHSNFCSFFKKNIDKTPEEYRKWSEIVKSI